MGLSSAQDLNPERCRGSQNFSPQERISQRMCEQIGVVEVPMISSQECVEVNNLERVEQFKTRYQKHYANDEDELETLWFLQEIENACHEA